MKNIAFIGLGNMGAPMCENLVKTKYNVFAYDLNQKPVKKLAKLGATPCKSLRELEGCDVYITMLQNGAQVKHVCIENEHALMHIAAKRALFIDCSSIDVDTAREIHEYAKEKKTNLGIRFQYTTPFGLVLVDRVNELVELVDVVELVNDCVLSLPFMAPRRPGAESKRASSLRPV